MSLWFADSKIACSHSTITPFKHLSHFKWCMFSTNVLVCWCVCACACVSFTRAIRNNGTVWLIFRKIDTWIWHSSSHIFAFAQNAISMTQSAKAIETHSVVGNICDGNSRTAATTKTATATSSDDNNDDRPQNATLLTDWCVRNITGSSIHKCWWSITSAVCIIFRMWIYALNTIYMPFKWWLTTTTTTTPITLSSPNTKPERKSKKRGTKIVKGFMIFV